MPSPATVSVDKTPTSELLDLLEPISRKPRTTVSNWSRTFRCTPACVFDPETDSQCELILELAKRRMLPVRATGVGHSPSDIACTHGFLICTLKLNRLLEVNVEKEYVIVQGGMTLDDLHRHLDSYGLAMSNMGSISDQTVAGVTTVATHGTGIGFKVVPSQVISMTLLLANGQKVYCSREERSDLFLATLCGFGATGFVLSVQLAVERKFYLEEVQERVAFSDAMSRLDEVVITSEHVRFWWFPTSDQVVIDAFNRVYEGPKSQLPLLAKLAHIRGTITDHAIELLLLLGLYLTSLVSWAGALALWTWFPRQRSVKTDLSYRIFNLDCKFRQHTIEWAIPFERASQCLEDLRAHLLRDRATTGGRRSPDFPVEIRFTNEDDIYLSPSYRRKTCWIGVVRYTPFGFSPPAYREAFEAFEVIMTRHSGRPHWSKRHSLTPSRIENTYPCFQKFLGILDKYDPSGVFRNDYVRRHLFGEDLGEKFALQ